MRSETVGSGAKDESKRTARGALRRTRTRTQTAPWSRMRLDICPAPPRRRCTTRTRYPPVVEALQDELIRRRPRRERRCGQRWRSHGPVRAAHVVHAVAGDGGEAAVPPDRRHRVGCNHTCRCDDASLCSVGPAVLLPLIQSIGLARRAASAAQRLAGTRSHLRPKRLW
jgi:hypothetical protein